MKRVKHEKRNVNSGEFIFYSALIAFRQLFKKSSKIKRTIMETIAKE